jgi:prevent-host-death family protein
MSSQSIAEARSQLSKLIDRALNGEGVVITRRGRPVVELRPVAARRREPRGNPSTAEAEREILEALRTLPTEIRVAAANEVRRLREENEG